MSGGLLETAYFCAPLPNDNAIPPAHLWWWGRGYAKPPSCQRWWLGVMVVVGSDHFDSVGRSLSTLAPRLTARDNKQEKTSTMQDEHIDERKAVPWTMRPRSMHTYIHPSFLREIQNTSCMQPKHTSTRINTIGPKSVCPSMGNTRTTPPEPICNESGASLPQSSSTLLEACSYHTLFPAVAFSSSTPLQQQEHREGKVLMKTSPS